MKPDLRRFIKKLIQSGRMNKPQLDAFLETLGDPENLTAEAVAIALARKHNPEISFAQCRNWTPEEIELLSKAFSKIR